MPIILGGGHAFAVGLEGAGVVTEVLARYHDPIMKRKSSSPAWPAICVTPKPVATRLGPARRMDLCGHRPDARAAGRRLHRPGDQIVHRRALRRPGAVDGGRHHYARGPVRTGPARGLLRPDGARAGGQSPGQKVGGRRLLGWYRFLLASPPLRPGALDSVRLPGDMGEDHLARILGDVATLVPEWRKPLAARLLPAPGKKAGNRRRVRGPAHGQHHDPAVAMR